MWWWIYDEPRDGGSWPFSYDGFHDDHVERLRLRHGVGLSEQLESLRTTIPGDLYQWSQ
jgi:hypothetical protein